MGEATQEGGGIRPVLGQDWSGVAEAARRRMRVLRVVLVLGLVIMSVKVAAFLVTGSQAVLSDAVESVANLVTAAFALFSAWLASKPPDREHPYGHGRVELFAGALEGAVVLLAALGIAREALPALFDPQPIRGLGFGLSLAAGAGLANGVAGVWLLRLARRERSVVLRGEGVHLLTDTVTTAGVLVGLLVVEATGWLVLDPIVALLFAGLIATSGLRLLFDAGSRLMHRQDEELLAELVGALERSRVPGSIDVHLLRAWNAADLVHADFHLAMPRYWSLERVDEHQHEVAEGLARELGRPVEVLIHPDPCRPKHCRRCDVEQCPVRTASYEGRDELDVEQAVTPADPAEEARG